MAHFVARSSLHNCSKTHRTWRWMDSTQLIISWFLCQMRITVAWLPQEVVMKIKSDVNKSALGNTEKYSRIYGD